MIAECMKIPSTRTQSFWIPSGLRAKIGHLLLNSPLKPLQHMDYNTKIAPDYYFKFLRYKVLLVRCIL